MTTTAIPTETSMTPRRRSHDQDPAPVVILLVLIALMGAAVMVGYASGCGPVREKGRDVVSGLVDCTVGNAAELAPYVIPFVESVLKAATQPDGKVDWSQLRALLTRSTDGHAYEPGRRLPAGLEVVSCALATVVLKSRAPAGLVARTVPAGDPGFEDLRATMLGGMVFKTTAGAL